MGIYLHQWTAAEPEPQAGCGWLRRDAPPFEMTASAGKASGGLHGDEDGTWVQVTKRRSEVCTGSEVELNGSRFEDDNPFGALEEASTEAAVRRRLLVEAQVEKNCGQEKFAEENSDGGRALLAEAMALAADEADVRSEEEDESYDGSSEDGSGGGFEGEDAVLWEFCGWAQILGTDAGDYVDAADGSLRGAARAMEELARDQGTELGFDLDDLPASGRRASSTVKTVSANSQRRAPRRSAARAARRASLLRIACWLRVTATT
ncbi:unnamed protein product [Prorocentrum cordatum]|uniref:Uncharacterized protein n=1 Tax=Prorocentrum cordatum TaxID=2364126 RepID=A0ABN9RKW7_9DINO|nr:unnamed protein product [Polarella glacialis]